MTAPSFEAPQIAELQKLLPAYEILDFIAQGGMGAVYRARQISLDREVAVKILPREFGDDPEFRNSFAAEAKAMAKLNHPNLIGVYDFGEVEGLPYIVMEYVHGKALHYSAHGQCIEQSEAASLILGICKGLAHAHEEGVLHRDIKPANILLDSCKQPKIGDFGLACAIDSAADSQSGFGTPGFSAPEVIHSPAEVDKRSDVYSVGILFYQLLTSELPPEPYLPASRKASVAPSIDQFIRRATHPSPTHRFSDAGVMAVELGKLLTALPKPRKVAFNTGRAVPITGPLATPSARYSPAKSPVPAVGTNWPLLRNLVIIAILLVAIFFVQREIKDRKKDSNTPVVQAGLPAMPKVAPMVPNEIEPPVAPPKAVLPIPPPEIEEEAPLEALARLRGSLASGERIVFPPQTLEADNARYFFVETPMPWREAAAFAEEHGGHLATAPNDSAIDLLSTKIPDDQLAWVGGGPVSRGVWGWIDGSEWISRVPSTGPGAYAALAQIGVIKFKPGKEKHPFFIQWGMDGKNPGSLLAQLERTEQSIGDPSPTYPPGTLSFESRHYLVVNRAVSWDEAHSVAARGNAHLAVPSDTAENEFLRETLRAAIGDACTCWIGMQRHDHSFDWTTKEPWHFAEWAPGFPKEDAPTGSVGRYLLGDAGGWQHVLDSSDSTDAFIIEWSDDHKRHPTVEDLAISDEIKVLRTRGAKAIELKNSPYQKAIRKNTDWMAFRLNGWPGKQNSNVKRVWEATVPKIIELVDDDGRFNWPENGLPLHEGLQKIVSDCIFNQNKLDADFCSSLEELRNAYLFHLEESVKKFLSDGLKGEVQKTNNEIAACGTLDGFLLNFDCAKIPKPIAPMDAAEVDPFMDWVKTVSFRMDNGTSIFINGDSMAQIHPNGSRIAGFKPSVQEIDEAQRMVIWKYFGRVASITVDLDRNGGVWTRNSGSKHRVSVVPKE